MDNKFAGESFESCTKRDRAGTVVVGWHCGRILPAAQRIVFSRFDAIDVSNKKRIDVDMEGVDPTRAVVVCPLFRGTKWNAVFDFPVVRLTINSELWLKHDLASEWRHFGNRFQSRTWQNVIVRPR